MPVVCDQCGTENRESAKFCRGCAAKLPAFSATGPSALESMKMLPSAPAPLPPGTPTPGMLPIETRAFWVRFAVLSVVITTAFVSWYAYVTRKVPPGPAPRPPAAVMAAAPAAPASPVSPAPLDVATVPLAPIEHKKLAPAEPVRAADALDPSESFVEPGAARREPAHAAQQPRRSDAQAEAPRKIAARPSAADPRPTCAHLNFIAAARCQAAQCAKPLYYKHPHCSTVREQTRRDVARRNPMQLGS